MTDDRILGHLAQRFAVSEENLATEALTWLLRRSAAARAALAGFARAADVDVPGELTFTGQVGSPDTGRPDVVGIDASSRKRFLIEAKFAAALTDQQPGGYLRSLPPDVDGIVLVVAPEVRLATLWVELLRAVPELAATAPSPSAVPTSGLLSAKVGLHATLALVSWRRLVSRVLDALRAAGESVLAEDAEQLLALTEAMDRTAFTPLRPGDLDTRTARQIAHMDVLIDETRRRIAAHSTVAEPQGNMSHGRTYYGRYINSRKTGKAIWYGFWPHVWARNGISPLWVQVKVTPSWSRQRLLQALSGLHETGQAGLFEHGSDSFWIPLTIPQFAGEDEVVDSLRSQLESVISRLDSVIPEGAPPVAPDEDEIEDAGADPAEAQQPGPGVLDAYGEDEAADLRHVETSTG
ncbi:MAG TPA: hypothetical protein VI365_32730 [Trebonia sp.]